MGQNSPDTQSPLISVKGDKMAQGERAFEQMVLPAGSLQTWALVVATEECSGHGRGQRHSWKRRLGEESLGTQKQDIHGEELMLNNQN